METQEQRLAAYETELRAKYSDADRKKMAGKEAMGDGSYPVADAEDLTNAIHAVGRGGADHDTIRAHIIARAAALGLSNEIPDNWAADGSLKQSNAALAARETRAENPVEPCPTCDGSGKIMDGNRTCPDCDGTGEKTAPEERAAPTLQDPKVAAALTAAHTAVQTARDAQALDPDKDTDPDDAAVTAHLDSAHEALTNALAAQAHDGDDEERSRTPLARRRRERHRAVPLYPEVRHFPASGLEVRSVEGSHEVVITGAPIVYDTPYTVVDAMGEFEERMSRGVARDVIGKRMDVRFLFNHGGLPLARSTSGTMTLRDSPEALRFEARLDSRQQLANDLVIAIERGDVSQMSCGFVPAKDEWNKDMTKRNVTLFRDLPDISAVTYPCSPSTSVEVARRMAMEIPVESHARLRRLYVETRAGAMLNSANKTHLTDVVKTLHQVLGAAGVDPASLLDEPESETTEADEQELPGVDEFTDSTEGGTTEDGTQGGNSAPSDGIRSDDPGDAPVVYRKTLRSLRLEVETRKRRRIAA